jgi:anti-sigma factor RsiW
VRLDQDEPVTVTHVTDTAIDAFGRRGLTAPELVQFADHLAACEECRGRVAARRNLAADRIGLEGDLGLIEHVSEEEIHAYVDRRLDSDRRFHVAAHLRQCQACEAEVSDLERFAAKSHPQRHWRRPTYLGLAAAAVLVVAVATWRTTQAPEAHVVVALHDKGSAISLDADGTLHAHGSLGATATEIVRRALVSGALAVPAAVRDLAGAPGTLMGGSEAAAFHLEAPVATRVLEDRPTFHWTLVPGATSYTVTVQQQDGGDIVSSSALTTATWTPDRPLTRGRTYLWQVAASGGGREVVAPLPPAPPAKFAVLDTATALELARLPPSHAVRGILYANVGLLDDAEQELTALAAVNPESALVRSLLRQLRASRLRLEPATAR